MKKKSPSGRRTTPNKTATAFAPATVANVAVGFDILGFPIQDVGDRVTVTRLPERGRVEISAISGGDPSIPQDAAKNTATAGLIRLAEDLELPYGFQVSIEKGIPIGSGMGGSSASAVAAVLAANAVLDRPLARDALLIYALEGEAVASGARHADNVAPCLLGGLVLSRSLEPLDCIRIPTPRKLLCVLVHPSVRIDTRDARRILRPQVALQDHIRQSANLAGFIAGCYSADMELIGRSLCDVMIEPQRAHLIPGFYAVKQAALSAGALGCSISGSGPSVFAIAPDAKKAAAVRKAMVSEFEKSGATPVESWVSPISLKGAQLL